MPNPEPTRLDAAEIESLKRLWPFANVGELEFDSNEAQYRICEEVMIFARKEGAEESNAVLAVFEDESGQSRDNFAHFLCELYNAFPSIIATIEAQAKEIAQLRAQIQCMFAADLAMIEKEMETNDGRTD